MTHPTPAPASGPLPARWRRVGFWIVGGLIVVWMIYDAVTFRPPQERFPGAYLPDTSSPLHKASDAELARISRRERDAWLKRYEARDRNEYIRLDLQWSCEADYLDKFYGPRGSGWIRGWWEHKYPMTKAQLARGLEFLERGWATYESTFAMRGGCDTLSPLRDSTEILVKGHSGERYRGNR